MPSLSELKSGLRQRVPENMADTLDALQKLLSEDSDAFQQALALEGRLREADKNRVLGVTSQEQLELAYNRLRRDLLDLLGSLEEGDLAGATGARPARRAASREGQAVAWKKYLPWAVLPALLVIAWLAWPALRPAPADPAQSAEAAFPGININGLAWMARNLDTEGPDSWCYEDDPANCRQYGRLYTWQAARDACAKAGWRLPTLQEALALAGARAAQPADSLILGPAPYQALLEGGSSGFSAGLGGWRTPEGAFYSLGDYGDYWTATEHGEGEAWILFFNREDGQLKLYPNPKEAAFSCRCVRDR